MADVPAGAQPATPREVLIGAYLAEYNSNASAARRALSALSAAGFEVLPRALVDAVLNLLAAYEHDEEDGYVPLEAVFAARRGLTAYRAGGVS